MPVREDKEMAAIEQLIRDQEISTSKDEVKMQTSATKAKKLGMQDIATGDADFGDFNLFGFDRMEEEAVSAVSVKGIYQGKMRERKNVKGLIDNFYLFYHFTILQTNVIKT